MFTGPRSLWKPRPLVRHSGEPFQPTAFFENHQPAAVLSGLPLPCGLNVQEWGSGSSGSNDLSSKDFELEIKGNSPSKDSALTHYREAVFSSLKAAGIEPGGQGVTGDVSSEQVCGFYYLYSSRTARGLIRVTSHRKGGGPIMVDIFMYEHP